MSRVSERTLRNIQLWMISAITGSEMDAQAQDIERFVKPGLRMSAKDQFEIYRDGYRARLEECLLDDYPVLGAFLGEARWRALCLGYIERYPSSSPNLNGFGRHLSKFCSEMTWPLDDNPLRVFSAELATLEWALVEVLHADCPPALDIGNLQSMPPEAWGRATFVRNDALRLLRFEYPVNETFIAIQFQGLIPERPPAPSKNAVAVYRKGTQLRRMPLTSAMLAVLGPLLEGQSLGEVLTQIEAEITDPDVLAETSASLMLWFRQWVEAGFFVRIELPEDPSPLQTT